MLLSPSLSLCVCIFLGAREREIETLELGSGCVGVCRLESQIRLYHPGVYLKWKKFSFFFSKSAFLLCDLWVWHKLNWSSHSIYNAGFYEKLPLKPKGGKTWFLALTDRKTTFKHLSHINFHKIMSKTIIQIMMATCNVFMMDPFLFLFLC